jgi:RNA recognition motif-containing protein
MQDAGDPKANCYITNIPETLTEDALRAIFNSYGTISRSKIAVHPGTQIRQGYAFVQFDSAESAAKAIAGLNGYEIDKKRLKVSLAKTKEVSTDNKEGKTNLYIVGLPPTYTKIELDTIFSAYGKIVGSRVMVTPSGESRGVGFVRYNDPQSAQKAIEAVNGTVPAGFKDPLSVQYAKEKDEKTPFLPQFPRNMPPYNPYGIPSFPGVDTGANLYITGLPETYSKLELDGLFAQFGRILNSRILKQPSGTAKGVSLVRIDGIDGAHAAIAALNGQIPPKSTEPIYVKLAKNQGPQKPQGQLPTPGVPTNVYQPVKNSPAKSYRYNPTGRPSPTPGPAYDGSNFNGNYQYQQPPPPSYQPPQGYAPSGPDFY